MSSQPPPPAGRAWSRTSLPVACVLLIGLAVVLVRPPLPIDETRYLQVFLESLRGSPLFLTLSGEPYAEKTPFLFWLARALTWLGLPPGPALRLVPPLAGALTVWFVARLGRRTGGELAGWIQAALWIPTLATQFLTFDSLLACTLWGALLAWVERRERALILWSMATLFSKGPVAVLFLAAFLWALAPLRAAGPGDARRGLRAVLLGLVPLALWALAAALRGGPEFASALLWDRWAGRVAGGATDHARAWWFYLPVALVGTLPVTPLLLARTSARESAPEWCRRLLRALFLLLLAFTLIRGKQAHYLVPAAPAVALLAAERLRHLATPPPSLRLGLALQLGLLASLALAGQFLLQRAAPSFGAAGQALLEGSAWRVPLALAAASALLGLASLRALRASAPALLALGAICGGASLVAVHRLAGELLFPHQLERALATRNGPIAVLGSSQHGLYSFLCGGSGVEKLHDEDELLPWIARNPTGLLLVEAPRLRAGVPGGLELVAEDVVHRKPLLVLARPRGRDPEEGASR